MPGTTETDPIIREIRINVTPETVFEFFTDPAKLTRWLAVEATLDPRPGGVCHQVHDGGEDHDAGPYDMRGEFVEVSPPDRVVFTWGFTNAGCRRATRLVHRGSHAGAGREWHPPAPRAPRPARVRARVALRRVDRDAGAPEPSRDDQRRGVAMTEPWMQLKSIASDDEADPLPEPWPDGTNAEYVERGARSARRSWRCGTTSTRSLVSGTRCPTGSCWPTTRSPRDRSAWSGTNRRCQSRCAALRRSRRAGRVSPHVPS